MKTAVSIPDSLFESADRLAEELGISRSQLYSQAVDRFVRGHSREFLSAEIDRVLERESSPGLDPFWTAVQATALADE